MGRWGGDAVWVLPGAAYMALIYALSSGPVPEPAATLLAAPHADKALHFLEFLVLGSLILAGLTHGTAPARGRGLLVLAILTGIAYAATDEGHQALVPGRSADLLDFAADSLGVTVGALLAHVAHVVTAGRARALAANA